MFRIIAAKIPRGARRVVQIGRWPHRPIAAAAAVTRPFSSAQSKFDFDDIGTDDDAFAKFQEEDYDDDDDESDDGMFQSEDDMDDETKARIARKKYRIQQTRINQEIDQRKGRAFEEFLNFTDDDWFNPYPTFDDIPKWAPEHVSRISQERVKLYPAGIPSLTELATLPLPPPENHPSESKKAYAERRQKIHAKFVSDIVVPIVTPTVNNIVAMARRGENPMVVQNTVDEMFETTEETLKTHPEMDILSKHPHFKQWVEEAIEDYLLTVQEGLIEEAAQAQKAKTENEQDSETKSEATDAEESPVPEEVPLRVRDRSAEPVFMDCFQEEHPDEMVPPILHPLKPHHRGGTGRMVEEWELAANRKSKRIMLRQCTRKIAQILEEEELPRIYVHGREGVGKSATLASIVAMARKSGHMVLYMPDGDRLRVHGYYVTPHPHMEGMFNLDVLSQEVCSEFLATHESYIEGVMVDNDAFEKNFTSRQLKFVTRNEDGSMSLVDLLKHAVERKRDAAGCYIILAEYLMKQTERPFLLVMDQFNCYYDRGYYYHGDYDPTARKPIPLEKITFFQPFLAAMGIYAEEDDDNLAEPVMMKRGGVLVATP